MGSGTVTHDRNGQRLTAASPEEMERLRVIEAARKKYDPSYISADEAKAIPVELAEQDPMLAARIRQSAEHWPESFASASEIFTALEGGAGEKVITEQVDSESLFTGRQVGDEGEGGDGE